MPQIPIRSRLRFTDYLDIDGVQFWDMVDLPQLQEQPDDISYTVAASDRIDLLAYKFYGDPVLWWVIALANDMELLPTDLHESDVIRIPSPRYVNQELFLKARNG